jgi:hypothetical protein
LAASTIRPGAEVSSDCTQEEAIMEGMFGEKAENNGPTKSSGNANHPAAHDYQIKHINTLALPKVSSEPQTATWILVPRPSLQVRQRPFHDEI